MAVVNRISEQEYCERDDGEVWCFHPHKCTLTDWRVQPDGSYTEALYRGGSAPVVPLLGITVALDALLDG